MKRSSTAKWQGAGKEGKGKVTSQSKELNEAPYAWNTRFKDEKGTNPEELVAAAHASCFSMKLSFLLEEAGYVSEEIETTATVTMEDGTLTESHLRVRVKVPGIEKNKFDTIAEKARTECPMSKALNMRISMDAFVENPVAVS